MSYNRVLGPQEKSEGTGSLGGRFEKQRKGQFPSDQKDIESSFYDSFLYLLRINISFLGIKRILKDYVMQFFVSTYSKVKSNMVFVIPS